MTVAAILKDKGFKVTAVAPHDTVAAVVAILAEARIGAVLVIDETAHLQGILSERDVVRALARHGAAALALPASELMTRDITTATPNTTVAEAMATMTCGRFRHLPVIDRGELVGLISIGDVVKARMSQQEHEVDSLKSYVVGA
jgi:CBS domain-containing protein